MAINTSRFGVGFGISGFGAQDFGFHLRNKGLEVENGLRGFRLHDLDLGNKRFKMIMGLGGQGFEV